MGKRDSGSGQLSGDAERVWPEPRSDHARMEPWMTPERPVKTCIYPGCDRPAVPPHLLGGPQPSFCNREEHNVLTAHQERQRLAQQPTATRQEEV